MSTREKTNTTDRECGGCPMLSALPDDCWVSYLCRLYDRELFPDPTGPQGELRILIPPWCEIQPEEEWLDDEVTTVSGVARIIFLMCQGKRYTTAEVASLIGRHRSTAYRTLRGIEASSHVPLYFDSTNGTWGILQERLKR